MIDIRSPNDDQLLFKSGGHSGMIKSIWVSDDETLLYTGGCDGTVRLWDMGTRSVIQTYGEERKACARGSEAHAMIDELSYHTDSITTLMPSNLNGKIPNGQSMLTAGRDGNICEVDCLTRDYNMIYSQSEPVTCISPDTKNGFMWYATASSSINCFQLPDQNARQEWGVQEAFGGATKSLVKDD